MEIFGGQGLAEKAQAVVGIPHGIVIAIAVWIPKALAAGLVAKIRIAPIIEIITCWGAAAGVGIAIRHQHDIAFLAAVLQFVAHDLLNVIVAARDGGAVIGIHQINIFFHILPFVGETGHIGAELVGGVVVQGLQTPIDFILVCVKQAV